MPNGRPGNGRWWTAQATWHLARQPEDLDIMVGTPGLGIGSFVRFGHEKVSMEIRPVVEIDFPGDGGRMIHLKTTLDKRC